MGKPYDKEFKLQTVRMIQDEGKPGAQVARELGINDNTLYRWIAEYKQSGQQAFPGSGQLKPDDKAIRDMQKRIRDLEEENWVKTRRSRGGENRCPDHEGAWPQIPNREEIQSNHQLQSSAAGARECIESAVYSRSAESGMDSGHHVYPDRRRLVVSGEYFGCMYAQNRWFPYGRADDEGTGHPGARSSLQPSTAARRSSASFRSWQPIRLT